MCEGSAPDGGGCHSGITPFWMFFCPLKQQSDRIRITLVRFMPCNHQSQSDCEKALRWVLHRLYPQGPKRFTVFVCPTSGSGKGEQRWNSFALPVLNCSRHQLDQVVVTTHKGHAEEYVAGVAAPQPNDVYVVVGGDGMMHEIINGICERKRARADACDELPPVVEASVGMLPAGSGCAFAKTLGVLDPVEGALAFIRCESVYMDLMRFEFVPTTYMPKKVKGAAAPTTEQVTDVQKPPRRAFLSLSFAITSDIDCGSEKYRFMGSARFTVYALEKVIFGVPHYKATVRYLPCDGFPVCDTGPEDNMACMKKPLLSDAPPCTCNAMCDVCLANAQRHTSNAANQSCQDGGDQQRWVTLPIRDYLFLMVCKLPYIAPDMKTAPLAHLSDGTMDLVWSHDPKIGRIELLSFMSDMEKGKHVNSPKVFYLKVRGVEVLPHEGIVMADGEMQPFSGLRAVLEHRAVSVVRSPSL